MIRRNRVDDNKVAILSARMRKSMGSNTQMTATTEADPNQGSTTHRNLDEQREKAGDQEVIRQRSALTNLKGQGYSQAASPSRK